MNTELVSRTTSIFLIIIQNSQKNIFNVMKTKVFYNGVVQEDLFFTIYDYLRFNPNATRQYNILSTNDLNNLTLEDWKDVAEDAIYWLMHDQLPKVTVLGIDDDSPSMDTWGTLYYQTLAYIDRTFSRNVGKKIRGSEIETVINLCNECIEDLKDLMNEIHEPTDNEI